MKSLILLPAVVLFTVSFVFAQKNEKTTESNSGNFLSIGEEGIRIGNSEKDRIRNKKTVKIQWGMFDFGINALHDKTNYNSTEAQQYLNVPADKQNGNLFTLRPAKSINVNIWPMILKAKLFDRKQQQISLYTGIGLQLYNFRFNKNVSYLNEDNPIVIEDSVNFSKNKLAFAYLSVPVMLNFKTRISNDLWMVYGFGLIGGYNLDSWTKQISEERGKQKKHDQFNFQKFNLNLSGEIGVNHYIRLYGTYQVTNLYENSLNQHPFSLGIRLFGV